MSESELRTTLAHSAAGPVRREMRSVMRLQFKGYQTALNSKMREVSLKKNFTSCQSHFTYQAGKSWEELWEFKWFALPPGMMVSHQPSRDVPVAEQLAADAILPSPSG